MKVILTFSPVSPSGMRNVHWQKYLCIRAEFVDLTEILRRINLEIYDKDWEFITKFTKSLIKGQTRPGLQLGLRLYSQARERLRMYIPLWQTGEQITA